MIDELFCHYVDLVGLPRITNFVHLLGTRHLHFYVFEKNGGFVLVPTAGVGNEAWYHCFI